MMADADLAGRVAIITGAAGGFGQALSRAFVTAGMKVALADRSADGVARLHAELGAERTMPLALDVADAGACELAVGQVVSRFGRVDALVNNAALGMSVVRRDHMTRMVQIEDITPDVWASFMAVNLGGPFYMARAVVPGMRARKFGRIINVTTSYYTMLNPGFSPYGPVKSGLEAWSASLAGELKGTGITVNVVVPGGPADTPMVPEESGMDRSLLIRPERMAYPMLYLSSNAASGVSGRRFVAAHWDPNAPVADAAEKSGAVAGWPGLAGNPVWPGGGLKR